MRLRWNTILAAVAALSLLAMSSAAMAAQKVPANPDGTGVSALLIPPRSGIEALPKGWRADTSGSYANCQLAGESLVPEAGAEVLLTTASDLPQADYEVYLCCLGRAKARIRGAEQWTDVGKDGSNRYGWTRVGKVLDATKFGVEIQPIDGASLRYAGLVAEGSALPIAAVAKVVDKMRKGEPVTIVVAGDSVTENAKGMRGGSSSFDKGNPGAFKALLQEQFGTEVAYVSHRDPPTWPDDGDPGKIRTIEIDGRTCRDGRVEVDASKKIRLVNFGVGGAASDDAWHRFGDTFTESRELRKVTRKDPKTGEVLRSTWNDTSDTKLPPILRYGVAHYRPDLVIINYGTNDANGSHKGWTAADYLWHMKVLATTAQQKLGAAVILSTPHLWTRGTHQQPHTQPEMTEALRQYARRSGFALADVYKEYRPDEYDGIHPGDGGHRHIADAYMRALLGAAREGPAGQRAANLRDNGDGTVTVQGGGLMVLKDAGMCDGLLTETEAVAWIDEKLNRVKFAGHDDWRLPARDELLALLAARHRPALPQGHPFLNVRRYYLTTTREAKRNFFVDVLNGVAYWPSSMDDQRGSVWPVRAAKE